MGIEAGLAWGELADATVVYVDRGISNGMRQGIDRAKYEGRPIEYRAISPANVSQDPLRVARARS